MVSIKYKHAATLNDKNNIMVHFSHHIRRVTCAYVVFVLTFASSLTFGSKWHLDYSSGEGVLFETTQKKEIMRLKFEEVTNLEVIPHKPHLVFGDLKYTYKQTSFCLKFSSLLETKTAYHQNDESLQLSVVKCRYCYFAGSYYHLPPIIEKVLPYEPLHDQTKIIDLSISDSGSIVYFTVETPYIRPMDQTVFIHSKKCFESVNPMLLRYDYDDAKKLAQATYEHVATYQGNVIFKAQHTSSVTIPYAHYPMEMTVDSSTIRYVSPTTVSFSLTETWQRPGEETLVKISESVQSPILNEYIFEHNDIELITIKLIQKYVLTFGRRFNLPLTSQEIIPYERVSCDDVLKAFADSGCDSFDVMHFDDDVFYKRADGTYYQTTPTVQNANLHDFEML